MGGDRPYRDICAGRTRRFGPTADPREALRPGARDWRPDRGLRQSCGPRHHRTRARVRLFRDRQVFGSTRAAQGARPAAWPVCIRQVRPVQARHPIRDAGPGLPQPCPLPPHPKRAGACPLPTLTAVRSAGARVHEIVLEPLEIDDVGRLVADALHCKPELARPLAELVQEKTGGNPFFAIQFFIALADEGLLAFDPVASAWQWNIDRIPAKSYADNVVDLMEGKLKECSHA